MCISSVIYSEAEPFVTDMETKYPTLVRSISNPPKCGPIPTTAEFEAVEEKRELIRLLKDLVQEEKALPSYSQPDPVSQQQMEYMKKVEARVFANEL